MSLEKKTAFQAYPRSPRKLRPASIKRWNPRGGYIIDFDWGGIQAVSQQEIFFQQSAACGRAEAIMS